MAEDTVEVEADNDDDDDDEGNERATVITTFHVNYNCDGVLSIGKVGGGINAEVKDYY